MRKEVPTPFRKQVPIDPRSRETSEEYCLRLRSLLDTLLVRIIHITHIIVALLSVAVAADREIRRKFLKSLF